MEGYYIYMMEKINLNASIVYKYLIGKRHDLLIHLINRCNKDSFS